MPKKKHTSPGINAPLLKATMKYKGLKQKDVAQASGMSQSQLSQVLNGKASLEIGTIQRLAKAVDLMDSEFVQIFYNREDEPDAKV